MENTEDNKAKIVKYEGQLSNSMIGLIAVASFIAGIGAGYLFWGEDAHTHQYNKKHGYS